LLAKDTINKRSNQKNIGTVISSNLCTEIMQHSSKDEIAVCNLASITLPRFVDAESKTIDFRLLRHVVDLAHRPLGIGVSGLADVFAMMGMAWSSPDAKILNRQIFENIYYQALVTSNELAMIHGPYDSYYDSPISQGLFQFDLELMPTTSTHRLQGYSEGFEPYYSNLLVIRNKDGEVIDSWKLILKDWIYGINRCAMILY